tara:strand:- start:1112 stop:1318 length:207 start_codon:yes stop_codon:yes gene_type:complete
MRDTTNNADALALRDNEGRYRHTFEKICVCGHTNGQHTAERVKVDGKMWQECLEEGCGCECFKKAKKA